VFLERRNHQKRGGKLNPAGRQNSSRANGALGEQRRQESDGISPEIAPPHSGRPDAASPLAIVPACFVERETLCPQAAPHDLHEVNQRYAIFFKKAGTRSPRRARVCFADLGEHLDWPNISKRGDAVALEQGGELAHDMLGAERRLALA
jgi:hypothetical protein